MNVGDQPAGRGVTKARRKQNLAALLDALQELQRDEQDDSNEVSPQDLERELARPVALSDERLGAEAFDKLDATIKSLDRDLRRLANVSRDLASSVGVVRSTDNFRNRLSIIRALLRINAADLFPHRVKRTSSFYIESPGKVPSEKDDLEELPEQFRLLVVDVGFFVRSLNDFSESKDEALNDSITVFEKEIKYLSNYMKDFKGQFKDNAIKKYIHDVTEQHLREPIEDVAISLSTFIDTGVRAIRSAQSQAATNYLTLSTVGTFFSAVTATTLQFSFSDANTTLQILVNSFWFCSLVFSIASVLNGLLAYMWEHALYRSPGHYAPWWVTNWIKRSPLIFLIISAAAFSVGLCVFAYSSNQNIVTSTLTTVITSVSSIGLGAVAFWIVCEKWTYMQYQGEKWLLQIIDDVAAKSPGFISMSKRLSLSILRALTSRMKRHDAQGSTHEKQSLEADSSKQNSNWLDIIGGAQLKDEPGSTVINMDSSIPGGPSLDNANDRRKVPQGQRFRFSSRSLAPRKSDQPLQIHEAGQVMHAMQRLMRVNQQAVKKRMDRVGRSLLMLKSMVPSVTLTTHDSLVRHIQFSPNGEHLATCSWDKRAAIYCCNDFTAPPKILDHNEELLSRLAWSPAGDLLLCKMLRGVIIWTSEGEEKITINRGRAIESIAWFPHGEAFVSVEGGDVRKLDLEGKVMDEYSFGRTTVHDVAITMDSTRMVCAASTSLDMGMESPDMAEMVESRKEEMIIVYNLVEKVIECRVPVLGKSRNVKLSRDGGAVLVSFEDKTPPQRWKFGYRNSKADDGTVIGKSAFLILEQTYMPKRPVEFAGASQFGGRDDELVVCASKNGMVYVWDSKTGFLLHHYTTRDIDGDLTCLAWNQASEDFMFGTGRHNGTVRIWTPTTRLNRPPLGSSADSLKSTSPLSTSFRGY